MSNKPATYQLVQRVLNRILRAEMNEVAKGARWDAHTYHLARLVICLRSNGASDPYGKALQQLPLPCPSPHQPQHIEPVPEGVRIEPLWWVDGRNGRHWYLSIVDYLRYRSGRSWRSRRQMNTDNEALIYCQAIFLVNHAWNQPDPPPVYEALPAKKPAQSVKALPDSVKRTA